MINVYVSTVVENYFEHNTISLKIDSFCSYGSPPKIRSRHVEYTLYLLTANPSCQLTITKQLSLSKPPIDDFWRRLQI